MNESFSMGRALSLGASTMLRNLVPFAVLAALIYAPLILYRVKTYDEWVVLVDTAGDTAAFKALQIFIIQVTMGWGLRMLLSSSVTYGVVQKIRGQPAGIVDSVIKGGSRLPHTIVISLLVFALSALPGFLLMFVSTFLALCWVPCGVILYCMYYVAVPASVCERTGIVPSLNRSRDLTVGRKGGLFGLVAIFVVIEIFSDKIVQKLFSSSGKTVLYVELGVDICIGILGACVAASSYYLLRNEKEGTTADDLASVFD
jgi:hypothetical protein